jgi:hypothetical protein
MDDLNRNRVISSFFAQDSKLRHGGKCSGGPMMEEKEKFTSTTLKRRHMLPLLISLYVVASVSIVCFDLGHMQFGNAIAGWVAQIVPSINPTAAITESPDLSRLVLSIAWVFVPLCYFLMLALANWRKVEWDNYWKHQPRWVAVSSIILVPGLLVFMMRTAPHNSGIFNRFIFDSLNDGRYSVILYGAGIWLGLASTLFYLTFNLVYTVSRLACKKPG